MNKKGGARKGAGRPKGSKTLQEPRKALPKVPLSKYEKCLAAVKKVLGIK